MSDLINVWAMEPRNFVNGPGCRFVLWVQGCHLACPNCWNKHTWSFKPVKMIHIDDIFKQVAATEGITGVTFSGGEPFVQARSLYRLARRIKAELDLNLQIFTGYEVDELNGKHQKLLLELADVVVAGRFDPSKENNNQKVHEAHEVKWMFNNTNVEVDFDDSGNIVITGYPTDALVNEIRGIAE